MLLEEVDALTAKIDTLTTRVEQLLADIPEAAAPAPLILGSGAQWPVGPGSPSPFK